MAENTPVPLNRIERVLAFMAATVGGLSVVAILAVIIARLAGVTDLRDGVWPVAALLPVIGLPITLLLLVAFFIARAVRHRRLARGGH
ncbi:MAG TPA: multidrug ABC transporter ATPase [Pseudolysinimonas sp.]|nr:multidrug ABC transporter ATPase [Pseudolysinimonas sp.]